MTDALGLLTTWLNAALVAALPDLCVSVRAETEADMDFSASLYALTREAEMATVDWPVAAKQSFCRQQFDAQHAHYREHYPKAQFLLIERDAAPVGRLYFERAANELRLMEITLVAAARNLGISGALSSALLRHAHARGVAMGLHVEPFNPARRLYERQGFREVEARGLYLYMRCEPPSAQFQIASEATTILPSS